MLMYNTIIYITKLLYSTKFWWGKTLANQSFQSFGKENDSKFIIVNINYFSESGIWLGKILENDIRFANSPKFSPTRTLRSTVTGIWSMEDSPL